MKKQGEPKTKKSDEVKKCSDGKVLNTYTNRCIKVGSALYKLALKNGWIAKVDVDVPGVEESKEEEPERVTRRSRNCKNSTTFMLFDDVNEIPDSDLLVTPDGFCFSAEELVAYISSNAYNNKNPHELALELFTEKNLNEAFLSKHEGIKTALKAYFKKKEEEKMGDNIICKKTLDLLFEVCNTGRTCYFNNIVSHEKSDSSYFDRSIIALANLSEQLNKLSTKDKKAYATVFTKVDQANKGEVCIHGIGTSLMKFFIASFLQLDSVRYDSTKTGLIFAKGRFNGEKSPSVYFISNEHRFTLHPHRPGLKEWQPLLHKFIKIPSVEPLMREVLFNQKSIVYDNTCDYEPYLVTDESLDDWIELPDWRKIKFDKQCFDLMFLIKTITNDLNIAKNNNPFPKYPTNPFTQKIFTQNQLKHIKHLCEDNWIELNNPLKLLLNTPALLLDSKNDTWQNNFIDTMERNNMRFVRKINIVDGALLCTGEWNKRSTIVSSNERLIINYLNTADQSVLNSLKRKKNEVTPNDYYYNKQRLKSDWLIHV